MREDLPSRELQDLRPVPGDGDVPSRWALSVNIACTAWLLERGLLDSLAEDRVFFLTASAELPGPAGAGSAAGSELTLSPHETATHPREREPLSQKENAP